MPRFFQHWRILPKLQVWLLLVDSFYCQSSMLCISKYLYDLYIYFRFSPQFFNIINRCVKEQWPKNSSFPNCWLNVMICDLRPKKGWIYFSPWIPERWLSPQRTHKIEYFFQFLLNKKRDYAVKCERFFLLRLTSVSVAIH